MSAIGEYYRVLGVSADADTEEIKKAFRKLARTCHPDVAGNDPDSASKFAQIREAYETLADPSRRTKYDRRNQRLHDRQNKSHIRREWRPPGGWDGFSGQSKVRAARRSGHKKSDITLDDIFNEPPPGAADFGFGTKRKAPTDNAAKSDDGADIRQAVEVPGRTARLGGTVTLRYPRRRRSSDGVNVYNYDEIHDLRIPPRTCSGDVLRSDRMGHFSTSSNRYGDLIATLSVLEETGPHHPRRDAHVDTEQRTKSAVKDEPAKEAGEVRISLVEAILGGRVKVDTPNGAVHVTIPPGTSSGKMLRLKGKGKTGSDWYVRVEITVPKKLDEESRSLISRFAELNPIEDD